MRLWMYAMPSLLAAACVGETAGSDAVDGGASDAASDASSITPTWSAVCPASEPAQGSACSADEIDCEYGCGNVLTCADGTWGGASLFGSIGPCDAGANPASCPASLSAITPGASCSNGRCEYATGFCECDSPQDPTPDAGSTWSCGPQAGCPVSRPRVGSTCTTENQECDYQQCGSHEVCTNGAWQPTVGGGCGG